MSAETFQVISVTGYTLAAIFFVLAVILFFVMDIRGTISDLTGRTAARQIKELRQRNYAAEATHKRVAVYEELQKEKSGALGKVKATKTGQMSHRSRRLDITSGLLGRTAKTAGTGKMAMQEGPITDASVFAQADGLQEPWLLTEQQREKQKKDASDSKWTFVTELPTDVLKEEGAGQKFESEQPTDVLREQDAEQAFESEQPTDVLHGQSEVQESEMEQPTDVLDAQDIMESEAPTGVLGMAGQNKITARTEHKTEFCVVYSKVVIHTEELIDLDLYGT